MAINEERSLFSIWKLFLAIFLILVVLIVVTGVKVIKNVKDISIADSSITIEIPEGSGAASVADLLYEKNIIKYPTVFRLCSKAGDFDNKFKPGIITLHNDMSYFSILELLTSDRNTIKVVIPEGYTIKQIAEAVAASGLCTADEFYAVLDPSLYNYRFLEGLPERENRFEGYLFPATYEFMPNVTAQQIVDSMLKRFDEIFEDDYYKRAAEMNLTVDNVVIMASIIEREAKKEEERATIAGVFYNRINTNMPLQSCATVQYILGENKPKLSEADTQIDSPYNTYKNPGLPIGPIANPGKACIDAALWPEENDLFYFVADIDGNHHIFSKTYEEHLKAMEENGL